MDGDKFFALFGKFILILILILAIASGAFYLGKNYGQKPTSPPPNVMNPQPLISPTVSVATSNGTLAATIQPTPTVMVKKTYSGGVASGLSFNQYTILIGSDWVVKQEGDPNGSPWDKLTASKNGYEFSIWQAATGGAMCLYPGDPDFEGPSSRFLNYIEFAGTDGKMYRRGTTTDPTTTKNFTICEKGTDNYGQPISFGHTGYKVPNPHSQSMLEEMDMIVASLKKK